MYSEMVLHYRLVRSLLAAAFLCSSAALAAPTTWTFHNVTFSDGGTLSGTFNYDASNSTYSAVNVVSTAGTAFAGSTYSYSSTSSPTTPTFFSSPTSGNLLNANELSVTLATSLNVGTVANVSSLLEATCFTSNCGGATIQRTTTAGFVSADAASVPEPNTFASTLLIVAVAAFRLRRREATQR